MNKENNSQLSIINSQLKKVVVFGGSGFLGSYVSDELTRRFSSIKISTKKSRI